MLFNPPYLNCSFQIVMLRNEVRDCSASGVFLRLSAHGLIAENNIHSNGEAGLDIRKGADPIILVNSRRCCGLVLLLLNIHLSTYASVSLPSKIFPRTLRMKHLTNSLLFDC